LANRSRHPISKKKNHKKGLAELLKWQECLSSKSETLSSNPSATQKKKKKIACLETNYLVVFYFCENHKNVSKPGAGGSHL
jgi:hypothetical protein